MSQLFVIGLAMLIAGLWLHSRVAHYAHANPCLHRVQFTLNLCIVLWGVMFLIKVIDIHRNGLVLDALIHEEAGRSIAASLRSGEWGEAASLFGVGNRSYQFLLGVFYAVTSAPCEVTIIVNGTLACTGLLGLLDALARRAACRRVPAWFAACACALPSAVFWTTGNGKEGIMLWAICGIIRGGLLMGDRTVPVAKRQFVAHAITGLWLRPHIAAVWLAAVGAGVIVRQKKLGVLPLFGGGLMIALWGVSTARPEFVESFFKQGIEQTLAETYQASSEHYTRKADMGESAGNSTISYASGRPILLISGLALTFLRPYPHEALNLPTALAGAEVWFLSSALCCAWWRARHRLRLLFTPAGVVSVVGILLMAFYLSYCYNMGLVVRQRLQVFPGIVAMIALPLLARDPMSPDSAEADAPERRDVPQALCHVVSRARLPAPTSALVTRHRSSVVPARAVSRGRPDHAPRGSRERVPTDAD